MPIGHHIFLQGSVQLGGKGALRSDDHENLPVDLFVRRDRDLPIVIALNELADGSGAGVGPEAFVFLRGEDRVQVNS